MDKAKTFYIGPMNFADATSLHKLMSENKEHFGKYLPVTLSQNQTLEDSEAYIQQKAIENDAKTCITFAIKEKTTEAIAGLIIIKKIDFDKKQGEFAYGIGSKFESRGWTSGAVKEMLGFASKSLGLALLQIITHKSNIGSCKVAEKNGFRWQRTLEKEFTPTIGSPMDMELYELKL